MQRNKAEAKLLYNVLPADPHDPLGRVDMAALVACVEALGFEIECIGGAEREHLTVTLQTIRVRLAYREAPAAIAALRAGLDVEGTQALSDRKRRRILSTLADHKACLTVSVQDRTSHAVVAFETKQRLICQIVDLLLGHVPPALVLCPGADRLMTARETECWLAGMEDGVVYMADAAPDLQLRGKALLKEAPTLSSRAAAWLRPPNEAEAEDDTGREILGMRFAKPAKPPEEEVGATPAGRSALYVMSTTIAVFALPLGAAALAYNALSGGSLRLTSHVMAATGVFSAVDTAGWSAKVLRFVGLG